MKLCKCGKAAQVGRKSCGSAVCLHRNLHDAKRSNGETPCSACMQCEECTLFVHADKPRMHRGDCSRRAYPVHTLHKSDRNYNS